MDEYGNWIYLTPMVLGASRRCSPLAGNSSGSATPQPVKDPWILSMPWGAGFRKADSETELLDIEEEIDNILKAQRAKSAQGDESAVDEATLMWRPSAGELEFTIDELCLRRDRQLLRGL